METVGGEINQEKTVTTQAVTTSLKMPTTAPSTEPNPAPSSAPLIPTPVTEPSTATHTKTTSSTSSVPQKKTRREDRYRKEDDYVKQFTKAIHSAPTVEEKTQIAVQKYSHMVDDNKKMQFYIKQSEKRHTLVMKEKDQLQLEFNKTILVKSKLENLCRELQKQNKTIKEESLLKIREEEERRKETQAKFQSTLSEITALQQQNNEKNAKLREDNISMTEKFKSIASQFQLREQQIEKMSKQMSLEQQLADAKFMKASLEHQAEKERLLQAMEGLKVAVQKHRTRSQELQAQESGLRSQLAIYTGKYDEFQNTLVKSNQVFVGFKEEMEKMSKKIKKLEKESLSWKKRWETSQTALLDMCGERQASEERCAGVGRQLHNMQSLCRTLQAERSSLLAVLKENNIERPPLPAPVPAPAPPPPTSSSSKVDAMAANCAQLRQSLAHLQSQLNVLTSKQQPAENTTKSEKSQKKSKSKKAKKLVASKESESDSNAKESASESANEEKGAAANVNETVDKESEKTPGVVDIVEDNSETVIGKVETVISKVETVVDKIETVVDKVEKVDDKTETIVGKVETESRDSATDDKTLTNLIHATNSGSANLNGMQVLSDNTIDVEDVLDVDFLSEEDVTKLTDTASGDASHISKDTSNEQSPKNEHKIYDKGIPNATKVVLVTDRLGEDAKVVEFIEVVSNSPKIVEITEETANRPKIIELVGDPVPEPSNVAALKEVTTTDVKAQPKSQGNEA